MKSFKLLIGFSLISLLFSVSCSNNNAKPENEGDDAVDPIQEEFYTNPIYKPTFADPTIVKQGQYFYSYSTEDDWGNDGVGGYHVAPVIKSKNLIDWEYVHDALSQKPTWKNDGFVWAPDVTRVGDEYWMYYSYSLWGDPNPGIGLAKSSAADGNFVDKGKVFTSDEIGVNNSIDPFYIEYKGIKYLFFGSFYGIYMVQLSEDGTFATTEAQLIAGKDFEGTYIYKKGQYYYFFGSKGACCAGIESDYRVMIGRSTSLLGPYLDSQGRNLTTIGSGESLVKSNLGDSGFAGPGHVSEITIDSKGTEWILYHAIPKNNPYLDNGATRRPLMLDKLVWMDGWPQIENGFPSTTKQERPIFN